ncbi:MAG: (d)CMP kinase [Planctomycetaceae bacterium]|nr:(d)CMP kinase [Planctomycetaceae bacterium]
MIVTIDGPAGTGKSTVARRLAKELNFDFLDTGAMYRMLALKALRQGTDFDSSDALAELAEQTSVDFEEGVPMLDGEPVGREIRTSEVSRAASFVARIPEVRQILVEWQRNYADGRDIVCEGRDQGTVAFPIAECKFFLTASPDERARRRLSDLEDQGISANYDDLLQEQIERDERDLNRPVSPLKAAEDAMTIDTTELSVVDVIEQLRGIVQQRMSQSA